jgi:hypothetical protein
MPSRVTHLWGQERKASTVNFMGSLVGAEIELKGQGQRMVKQGQSR